MTPWTPVPPGTRQKKTPSPRPGTRQPCLPGGRDGSRAPFRRAHGKKKTPSPRQGVTPWTPVPPGRSRKTIAVPASRQSSTVLTGGRDGSRAPFRRAPGKKKTPSPLPGARQPCLPGGHDGSRAPFRRDVQEKQSPSPRPGTRQPSLRGRNPPFRGRLSHGHACFSHYSTAFRGQNPIAVGVCPKRRIFSENAQKAPVALQGLFVACFTSKILFFFCFRLCECANAMPLRPSGPELHPHLHGRTRIM